MILNPSSLKFNDNESFVVISLIKKIRSALGNARTVVKVGAGTGSYETLDRMVIPVEPSEVMIRQRPSSSLPAIRASADALPLHDKKVAC